MTRGRATGVARNLAEPADRRCHLARVHVRKRIHEGLPLIPEGVPKQWNHGLPSGAQIEQVAAGQLLRAVLRRESGPKRESNIRVLVHARSGDLGGSGNVQRYRASPPGNREENLNCALLSRHPRSQFGKQTPLITGIGQSKIIL